MILEGNQRGGARQMAKHLMNIQDNEHVEVHEISGFMSDTIPEALHEIYAASLGTKCPQYMFSVSLSPPKGELAPVEYFERAVASIEKKTGLEGQPRVIVFHEKEGRRHAHCIWSRIRAEDMKAINLPFYKQKLFELSKELYLQYGWDLPKGYIDRQYSDPKNFTHLQWQQAKRAGEDPRMLKSIFTKAWSQSDNSKAFAQALKEHGFWLAKGDRRGFVAIDYKGEIYSLSRWLEVKPKDLKQKLGEPEHLPSVAETKQVIGQSMTDTLQKHIQEVKETAQKSYAPYKRLVQNIKTRHQEQRKDLRERQKERWDEEEQDRLARLPRGIKSLWYRLIGTYQKIQMQNTQEFDDCHSRDWHERQNMIQFQLDERGKLQNQIAAFRESYTQTMLDIRRDIGRYQDMGEQALEEKESSLSLKRDNPARKRSGPGFEYEM